VSRLETCRSKKEPDVSRNWFYTHDGQTHGPVTTDEIKRLAASHLLLPDDLLWPEGVDREQAVSAGAALDYATPLLPTAPRPDWLDDVLKAELSGIQLLPPSSIPMPDWLDDIRTVEVNRLDKEEQRLPTGMPSTTVPDWLSDLLPEERPSPAPLPHPEEPLAIDIGPFARPNEPAPPAAPIPPAPQAEAPPAAPSPPALPVKQPHPAPAVLPIPLATPASPEPPAAPVPLATPVVTAPAETPIPLGTPATPRTVNPPTASPVALPPPPATDVEETGFDAGTGQILDAAKFKVWEQRQRQQRQRELESQSGLSYHEIYRKAQRELETWIDADENQELVLDGRLDAIQLHPRVQEILQHYRTHGQELVNKLTRHIDFVVDNRRKYHQAMKNK
jgi:hypothetical protein